MDTRYIIGFVAVVIVGWFAFGIIYNLRRGDALLKWMRGGLPKIGERTTFRWLGSSVAQMEINQAKKPFRQLTTMLFLAPRDVPWLWIFATAVGRRDTLIFRGQLVNAPRVDLELADPRSYTGRMAVNDVTQRGWESEPCDAMVLLAPKGYMDLARSTVADLSAARTQLSADYRRFGLRRSPPHFEAHVAFPDPRRRDAAEFFESLRALARAVNAD